MTPPADPKRVEPDKLGCGCPRIYKESLGHTCVVHDERGKRYDAYTAEEIAAVCREKIETQTKTSGWNCCCGRHGPDGVMPVGTRCIWRKTSHEYDEWECECLEANRDQWLACVTTDWHAMAQEMGQNVTEDRP